MIIPMRSDVSVQVPHRSNVTVTSLMVVVQRGWDAHFGSGCAMVRTNVVIGRMKSFVYTQNFIAEMMSALKGGKSMMEM